MNVCWQTAVRNFTFLQIELLNSEIFAFYALIIYIIVIGGGEFAVADAATTVDCRTYAAWKQFTLILETLDFFVYLFHVSLLSFVKRKTKLCFIVNDLHASCKCAFSFVRFFEYRTYV